MRAAPRPRGAALVDRRRSSALLRGASAATRGAARPRTAGGAGRRTGGSRLSRARRAGAERGTAAGSARRQRPRPARGAAAAHRCALAFRLRLDADLVVDVTHPAATFGEIFGTMLH